jgi:GDP-L-fucose synthase
MNILITGGNGFLAKNIHNKLVENHINVTSITRQDNFDLRDTRSTSAFLKDKYFDAVLHCAILGGKRLVQDPVDIVNDNIRMAANILINKNHFGKIINFGSGAELDRALNINDTSSFQNVLPEDYYGFSKNIISRLFLSESNTYNLRIYNVFSANESQHRMISSNIKNYINKKPIIIHQDKYMDFTYFDDFYNILVAVLTNNTNLKEIDCVYSKKFKLTDIAEIINSLDDHKVEVVIEKSELGKSYCGKNNLENIDFVGLEKGIKKVYMVLK